QKQECCPQNRHQLQTQANHLITGKLFCATNAVRKRCGNYCGTALDIPTLPDVSYFLHINKISWCPVCSHLQTGHQTVETAGDTAALKGCNLVTILWTALLLLPICTAIARTVRPWECSKLIRRTSDFVSRGRPIT